MHVEATVTLVAYKSCTLHKKPSTSSKVTSSSQKEAFQFSEEAFQFAVKLPHKPKSETVPKDASLLKMCTIITCGLLENYQNLDRCFSRT